MDYINMEIDQPTLEGNEISRHGQKLLLEGFLGNFISHKECRTPTLAKCGGEAQHLEKSGVGVLRDSQMFRAR
jgi:hypothetical protein